MGLKWVFMWGLVVAAASAMSLEDAYYYGDYESAVLKDVDPFETDELYNDDLERDNLEPRKSMEAAVGGSDENFAEKDELVNDKEVMDKNDAEVSFKDDSVSEEDVLNGNTEEKIDERHTSKLDNEKEASNESVLKKGEKVNVEDENTNFDDIIEKDKNEFENSKEEQIFNKAVPLPSHDDRISEDVSEDDTKEENDKTDDLRKKMVNDMGQFDDYQVEDNRSETKEEKNDNPSSSVNDGKSEPKDYAMWEWPPYEMNGINYPELDGNLDKEQPNIDQIISDTKNILEEENGTFEEDIETNDKDSAEKSNEETNKSDLDNDGRKDESFDDIIQNKIDEEIDTYLNEIESKQQQLDLNDSDGDDQSYLPKYENDMIDPDDYDFHNNGDKNDNDDNYLDKKNDQDDEYSDIKDEEETVDKVYEDLNADLDKLFATWEKLTVDSKISSEKNSEENKFPVVNDDNDDIKEYEEKYDRPYKEGIILQQRDDEELYADMNVDDDDTNMIKNNVLEAPDSSNEEVIDNIEEKIVNSVAGNETVLPPELEEKSEIKTISVDELNKEQYMDMMKQFSAEQFKDIDSERSTPIYMNIQDNETIEIYSPNYPNFYPTNNVVDWIVQGNGDGIELNITDLELRGAQGDYLLIRPGGSSETPGGLIFSYHLTQPELRHYRFTDVNQVFIRFFSGTGLNALPGFHLTVKQIWFPSSIAEVEMPEPEPLLPSPPATWTVPLKVTGTEYQLLEDELRRLIADMAFMYINVNGIDPGLNSTYETTQLSKGACMITWPGADSCITITFGVPLVYETEDDDSTPTARMNEKDLITMWNTYADRDPFAARMRALGVAQFPVPNDRQVMTTWVLLSVAIILAAALAGFGLWRYSCAEDYTRMKDSNDSDSVFEGKKGLDLYPTPHQPLPPLYADNDFKWADTKYDDTTRVDVGGFANRSYARDELLDIDSDEESRAPRDRNASYSPRNIYEV